MIMRALKVKLITLCVLVALIFAACEKDNFISNDNVKDQLKATQSSKENAVSKAVKQRKSTDFKTFKTFKNIRSVAHERSDILGFVSKGTIMDIAPEALNEIKRNAPNAIRLDVPTKDAKFELELIKADIFTDDFKLTTIDGQKADFDLGVHYRGIIKGDNNSLVALSFQDGELSGFFSNGDGNYVIRKMNNKKSGKNEHIVYLESDLTENYYMECATENIGVPYPSDLLEYEDTSLQYKSTGRGIRIYIEIDNDIFAAKGSNMGSFVCAIFHQSAALYANEGVNIQLSEMRYWPNPSPYTSTDPEILLSQFQNRYSSNNPFNGHIGGLVSFRIGASGIAGSIGEYCSSDIANRMFFSGINSSHSTPEALTYTRSVKVFAHELGHVLGSRHTHACVWNGNNTAIDGCGSCQEEPNPPAPTQVDCNYCVRPDLPSDGGTIMSYCDKAGVGINFSKGFGTQPGNVIRHTAAQMLNAINTWSYTQQLGWGYFYGDGTVYTQAYGIIYLWENNGDVCDGEGVWFYVYGGACGYGAGWFYDRTYGTGRLYSLEAGQWIDCASDTQGLIAGNDNGNIGTTTGGNHLKSSKEIMAHAPDFEKLNVLVQKIDINKLNIPK